MAAKHPVLIAKIMQKIAPEYGYEYWLGVTTESPGYSAGWLFSHLKREGKNV